MEAEQIWNLVLGIPVLFVVVVLAVREIFRYLRGSDE